MKASYEETRAWYVKNHGAALPEKLLNDAGMLKAIVNAFVVDMKVNLSFWLALLSEEDRAPFDLPCLIYWGVKDTVVSSNDKQPWLALFPNATPITVFPDAAHMLFGANDKVKEIMADIARLIEKGAK